MSIDSRTLLRRWFEEVWNQGREETVDELSAADAVAHGLGEGSEQEHSAADFKVFLRNMRSALPDLRIHVADTIVDGSKAVARLTVEGTHRGEGLGVPASGRRVNISGIVIVRIENGKIVEAWNSWDQLGLLQQVGAIGKPPGSDRFLAQRGA